MNKIFLGISVLFLIGSFILNLQFSKAGYRMKLQKEKYAIEVHSLPIDISPFDVTMIWHEKTNKTIAHKWLRSELSKLMKK